MHPLANLAEKVKGYGHLVENLNAQTLDQFGNPVINQGEPIELEFMLKGLTVLPTISSTGINQFTNTARAFLLTPGIGVLDLMPEIKLEDGRTMTIIDRSQKFLKSINGVFGIRFIVVIS